MFSSIIFFLFIPYSWEDPKFINETCLFFLILNIKLIKLDKCCSKTLIPSIKKSLLLIYP